VAANQRMTHLCFDFPHQGRGKYKQPGHKETHLEFDRAWHKDALHLKKQVKPTSDEEYHLLSRCRLPENSERIENLWRDKEGALVFDVKPVPAEAAQDKYAHRALRVVFKSTARSEARNMQHGGPAWDMRDHGINPDEIAEENPDATEEQLSEEHAIEWENQSETSSSSGDYSSEWEESEEEEEEEEEDLAEAAAAFVAL
jgi:cobalamin biosynthesis protein CobT